MGFMTFFHIECCTQAEVRAPLISYIFVIKLGHGKDFH